MEKFTSFHKIEIFNERLCFIKCWSVRRIKNRMMGITIALEYIEISSQNRVDNRKKFYVYDRLHLMMFLSGTFM